MKKTIWDHLLFIILIVLLILASSCEYEEYEPYIKDEIKDELKLNNYKESWDVIKHYPFETLTYSDFNYYSNCWLDNTALLADFDLDGDNDVMIAPDCTDDDQRQPPIKFFKNDKGKFSEWNINIDNNIGIISGTRTTIVGDYNNDKIPDVFFISHNGHGYGFGVPSILLSNENGFVFKDLDLEKKWYSDGTSGDIDNDGDLDIIFGGNTSGLLLNDGKGNFTLKKDYILNYSINAGLASLIDINKDGWLDLFVREYDKHFYILNSSGVFDYNSSVEIQMPTFILHDDTSSNSIKINMDLKDRVFLDYDNDGDLDIFTVSIPHNSNDAGFFSYLQVLKNNGLEFEDVSYEVLDKRKFNYYIEWLRVKDLNKNGNIEIFEHQKTNNWLRLEFNEGKFSSISG